MTPGYARELYLMRVHFGIGWREIEHDLPAWEVDVLRDELLKDLRAKKKAG